MKIRMFIAALSLVIGSFILITGIKGGRITLWNIHEVIKGEKLLSEVLYKQPSVINTSYLEEPTFARGNELCLKNDAALWLLGHKIFNFEYGTFEQQLANLNLSGKHYNFVRNSFYYKTYTKSDGKHRHSLSFESVSNCQENLTMASRIIFNQTVFKNIGLLAKQFGQGSQLLRVSDSQSSQLKYQRFLFVSDNNGLVKDFFIRDISTIQFEQSESFKVVKNVL